MALRRFFTTVLLVVISSLVAINFLPQYVNAQIPDVSSLSDSDLRTVTVRLERTVCFGSCPAYTVTIQGDGHLRYSGTSNVKVIGTREGRVEPQIVKALMSEFVRAKFLSISQDQWGKKCTCARCTDMPSAVTELVVRGVTHRVEHYYGCRCASKVLFELESVIDAAAEAEKWTGDVSKQGPFGTSCSG